jgi:hypothetical protein
MGLKSIDGFRHVFIIFLIVIFWRSSNCFVLADDGSLEGFQLPINFEERKDIIFHILVVMLHTAISIELL